VYVPVKTDPIDKRLSDFINMFGDKIPEDQNEKHKSSSDSLTIDDA
jgi:hypothetical protein